MRDRELVAVYADESCLGNGRDGKNPGGAGALIEYRHPTLGVVRRDLWICEAATTNNRMALRSVIEPLSTLGAKGRSFRVLFTSDSRYLVDGMTRWVHDWARRGWKRRSGPIENLELWREAIRAASQHEVRWRWVRGHALHAQNLYADHLATTAAQDQSRSGGLVRSGFEAWLAAARAAGVRHVEPEPFPDPSRWRPGRALPTVDGRVPDVQTAMELGS
jgi:ribonuclease HI